MPPPWRISPPAIAGLYFAQAQCIDLSQCLRPFRLSLFRAQKSIARRRGDREPRAVTRRGLFPRLSLRSARAPHFVILKQESPCIAARFIGKWNTRLLVARRAPSLCGRERRTTRSESRRNSHAPIHMTCLAPIVSTRTGKRLHLAISPGGTPAPDSEPRGAATDCPRTPIT